MARKFTKYPSSYVKASKSSQKITGRTWSEFIANLKSAGYTIDSAYIRNYNQWIILYDNDGNTYNAEVTKYFNGDYELMEYNITKHYGDDIEACGVTASTL